MKIDVDHLAKLSYLSIKQGQLERVQNDLDAIISLIDEMMVVDTTDIDPMTYPHDNYQRLREDVVSEIIDREEMQKSAPKKNQGYYLVPKVID